MRNYVRWIIYLRRRCTLKRENIARNFQPEEMHFCRTRLPPIRIPRFRLSVERYRLNLPATGNLSPRILLFFNTRGTHVRGLRVSSFHVSSGGPSDLLNFRKNLHRAERSDDLVKLCMHFMDMDPYSGKGRRGIPWRCSRCGRGNRWISTRVSRIFQFVFRVFESNSRNSALSPYHLTPQKVQKYEY